MAACPDGLEWMSECICATAKIKGGWCEACQVGHVAGLRVPSKLLFDTIDAHGHDFDPKDIRCPSCRQASETEGLCRTCGIGFVQRKAFFTPFSYQLGKGAPKDPKEISCPTCRRHLLEGGWCESCGIGMLGNVAVKDRAGFDDAVPWFRRLKLGLEHLQKCGICAVAIYANGMCPKCRIEYEGGRPVNRSEP